MGNLWGIKLRAATHERGMWRTTENILSDLYVHKNCSPYGDRTLTIPYQKIEEAVDHALSDSTITFLSSGTYDEAPPSIIADKKINIVNPQSVIID